MASGACSREAGRWPRRRIRLAQRRGPGGQAAAWPRLTNRAERRVAFSADDVLMYELTESVDMRDGHPGDDLASRQQTSGLARDQTDRAAIGSYSRAASAP